MTQRYKSLNLGNICVSSLESVFMYFKSTIRDIGFYLTSETRRQLCRLQLAISSLSLANAQVISPRSYG